MDSRVRQMKHRVCLQKRLQTRVPFLLLVVEVVNPKNVKLDQRGESFPPEASDLKVHFDLATQRLERFSRKQEPLDQVREFHFRKN